MKLPKLPDSDGKPQTLRDKIYQSTPVILAVVATVLAGLSSGEMTRAQYFRSLAAQQQGKATDQWGYYQAKKSRSALYQTGLDNLRATGHLRNVLPDEFVPPTTAPTNAIPPNWAPAFAPMERQLPTVNDKPINDDKVVKALRAVDENQDEKVMAPQLRQITDKEMDEALADADANSTAFDKAAKPASSAWDELYKAAEKNVPPVPGNALAPSDAGAVALVTDVAAARMQFNAARYDREARYNQVIGELYEVQVHRSGVTSERHAVRSSYFFYGMLAAQAGVTIATLALAAQKKSVFWSLATAAGITAITFSAYIYLFI